MENAHHELPDQQIIDDYLRFQSIVSEHIEYAKSNGLPTQGEWLFECFESKEAFAKKYPDPIQRKRELDALSEGFSEIKKALLEELNQINITLMQGNSDF